jgi:hypothetical protein
VVPARSSVHGLSCSRRLSPWSGRNSTYRPVQISGTGSDRGIDHGIFHVWLIRSGVEKMLENAGFAPITVTHEHTVPITELLRKVPPRAACSRDPQYSFNEQPVITPATPRITGFAQTMWLHLRPLGVRQNESVHQKLESQQASKGNPDSQQTLNT